jgi:protein SCO1/2
MFFGFTHCPDVCPTTLGVLRDVAAMLAADGEPAPRIVFVSVDPERDTPARLKSYVEFFDKRFIGLTGAPDKVAAFTGQLGIVYMKAPLPGTGGYTVDHTAAVLLVDPRVRLVGIFSAPHNAADIARRYMQIRHVVERDS